MRILSHPILGPMAERQTVSITFNGQTYQAMEGESIAAALLANGVRTLRWTEQEQHPRGLYCGIGHCFECRVTVNGVRSQRACITPVEHHMVITSGGENWDAE
ncbi:(2Fe-2S)-binding protein [Ammoniphilus resinae]|uniref:Sarcosine oxidase subunit alpha n=1 Tax=Ammoniphilus resinae TaxID=861532 RepID=A0ABS4GN82_9BACL|nr:(2Fe-2S)-binding protein [Ammoniphilus resinae]MBP1931723.1 sarcosine oxidase subunit alpha [Ammoniphilus resinae]